MNKIIAAEYEKCQTIEQIKDIFLKYGYPVSAMMRVRKINEGLSLKEIHDTVDGWRKE